jgi:hypothetical protein
MLVPDNAQAQHMALLEALHGVNQELTSPNFFQGANAALFPGNQSYLAALGDPFAYQNVLLGGHVPLPGLLGDARHLMQHLPSVQPRQIMFDQSSMHQLLPELAFQPMSALYPAGSTLPMQNRRDGKTQLEPTPPAASSSFEFSTGGRMANASRDPHAASLARYEDSRIEGTLPPPPPKKKLKTDTRIEEVKDSKSSLGTAAKGGTLKKTDRRFNSSAGPLSLIASARGPDNQDKTLTGRQPICMYMDCDDESLSEYQCFLRNQIELFEATNEDLQLNAQKMNKYVVLGQVGIRCRYCAKKATWTRARGAVYYSATLDGLYQAGQNMSKNHLCNHCNSIPEPIKQELLRLKSGKRRAGGGKQYWSEAARAMGVFEDQYGLRFKGPSGSRPTT